MGLKTLSSKCPLEPPTVTATWFPMTWAATMVMASHWVGLTWNEKICVILRRAFYDSQCTIGAKADNTRMFSRSLFLVFLMAKGAFLEGNLVRHVFPNVKILFNLDKMVQNLHGTTYSRS